MSGFFDMVLRLHGAAAYAIVFAFAMLEASAFVGFVVPGELAVLLGGVLAFQGKVALPWIALAATAGAIIGDSIGYAIGKRSGPRILAGKVGRLVGAERWERARAYLERRGARAVIVGRFTTALRVLVPGLAGMAGMPYGRFLVANVVGGAVWATGFTLLGYAAGSAWRRVEVLAGRASLILLALLVIIAAISAGARWIARNPDRVRAAGARAAALKPVAWTRRRFRAQIDFVTRRLDPRAATGLRLTAGLIAIVIAGWLFGALTEDVLARNELVRFDLPIAQSLSAHATAWLTSTMRVVTILGGALFAWLSSIAVVGVWWWRRRSLDALALLTASQLGGMLLGRLLKVLVHRPRPPVPHLVHATGWSFPSGHALQSVVLFGALAVLAGRAWPAWRARVRAWALAVVLAVLIGASRLILGVHYLTDVLGGYALGALWLAVVVTALGPPRPVRSGAVRPGPG